MRVSRIFLGAMLFCLLPMVVNAAEIRVEQVGDTTTYVVSYTDFVDVGGVQVFISYDPLTTNIQGLEQGQAISDANAIFSGYDDRNGKMNFAANTVRGFNRIKGELARVTIGAVGSQPPRIKSARAVMINTAAKSLPGPAIQVVQKVPAPPAPVTKPTDPVSGPIVKPKDTTPVFIGTGADTVLPPAATASATGTVITGGTVSIPADPLAPPPTPATPEEKTIELEVAASTPQAPASSGEQTPTTTVAIPELPKMVAYPSILQRLKDYTDELTPAALIGLFVEPLPKEIRQEPVIAYADGTSTFRVTVDSRMLSTSSPTMLLRRAKLKELKTIGDLWEVIALPLDKVVDGQLMVQDGERTIEIPLVIVPKIKLAKDKSGKVDPAEFARVIADRGKENSKYDFNGDGKHDLVDDYIYAANYIKQTGIKPTKPKVEQKAKAKSVPPSSPADKGKNETAKPAEEEKKAPPAKPKQGK